MNTIMKISRNHKLSLLLCALVAFAAIVITGCKGGKAGGGADQSASASQPPSTPVDVIPVTTGDISKKVSVVGNLQTLFSVNLSPKTAGRLIAVNVREGDPVKAGEVVAQIDPTQAASVVAQDEANVLSAKAKLDQATAQYQQSITTEDVSIENAKAALASAQVNLQKTITGDQPQQKAQAQDQLQQQQANFAYSQSNLTRQKQLYSAGAIAKADLDTAQNQFDVQQAQLQYYKQNLSLIQQGGRPEDIAAAKQVVVQDQANLRSARAGQANVSVAQQNVEAARAALVQQQQTVVAAEQDLRDTNLVSPINGVVAQRSADPGMIGQPGTTVLQIVDLTTMYYQPTVSETDLQSIAPGQSVSINVDAFSGKAFTGTVSQIFPSASTSDRQFSIRVNIPNSAHALRPGMYARGLITTTRHTDVVIVPTAALQPQLNQAGFEANTTSTGIATGDTTLPPQMVYLAGSDKKAHATNVVIGIVDGASAEVTSGLKPGDPLIVKGAGELQDGDPIKFTVKLPKHSMPSLTSSISGLQSGFTYN